MHWVQQYKSFMTENWAHTIWSDKCYIYLGDSCSCIFITQCANEEFDKNCLVPTFKQSSVCVMVWDCIMEGRKGPLIVLEYPGGKGGGMNTKRY